MQWLQLDDKESESKHKFELVNQVKMNEAENSENYYFIYVFRKADKQ